MTTSHTLIHIGAGKGETLFQYKQHEATRIVLVEPQPQLAEALRKATEEDARYEVLEAAIAPKGSNRPLFLYNLPEANSLYEPAEALLERFPGLKQREQLSVTLLTLVQLLEHLGINQKDSAEEQQHHLVIQAPGAEGSIVAELIDSGSLYCFSHIQITTGKEAYYRTPEHNAHASAIIKALQLAGFDATEPGNTAETDWPEWTFQYNPLHAELKKARTENQALNAALKEAQHAQEALQQKHEAQLESTRERAEEDKAKLKKQLEDTQAQVKKLTEETAEQTKAQAEQHKLQQEEIQQLKQRRDQLKKELEEAKAQHGQAIEQQNKEHQAALEAKESEHKKQLEDTQTQVKKLTEETAEQTKAQAEQHKQQQEEIQQLKQRRDQLKKELEEAKAQHGQAIEQQNKEHQAAIEAKESEHKKQLEDAQAQVKKITDESAVQSKYLAEVKQQLADAIESQQKIEAAIKQERAAHEKTKEALQNNQQWFANRKAQAEELKVQLEESQNTIQTLQSALDQLKQNSALEAKIEALFNQQKQQLTDATNALGKHITYGFNQQQNQLQNYLGLINYLETGETPLQYNGWAIGADLATHLVKTLEQHNFDLIIEFGSGTSTLLMAKTLLNVMGNTKTVEQHKRLAGKTGSEHEQAVAPRVYQGQDLPHRIISFEQHPEHQKATQNHLQQQQLNGLVELVLAPLVTSQHAVSQRTPVGGLFYDCDSKLQKLATYFEGRTAKIMVLVDGPHSPKGNAQARLPALPAILQYFSAHQIHCVLDDTHRAGEQHTFTQWLELCTERGLTTQQQEWTTEKGAQYLIINPA